MAKPFVGVIGERNSGKSTVIRSLTGCRNATTRDIVIDLATNQKIYVICNSPQETDLSAAEFTKTLRRCWRDAKCLGVVVAIQPTTPRTRMSMEDIFRSADAAGFSLYGFPLVVPRQGGLLNLAGIKVRLRGLKVKVTELDGRRFAHHNAALINKKTRVVG